jgi:hypothetical protein
LGLEAINIFAISKKQKQKQKQKQKTFI